MKLLNFDNCEINRKIFFVNHWVLLYNVLYRLQSPWECLIYFPWLFKPVWMKYEFSLQPQISSLVDYLSFFKGTDS
jgi:hypothetical protein